MNTRTSPKIGTALTLGAVATGALAALTLIGLPAGESPELEAPSLEPAPSPEASAALSTERGERAARGARGAYGAPIGTRIRCALRADATLAMRSTSERARAASADSGLAQSLRGQLCFELRGRREDPGRGREEILVHVRVEEAELHVRSARGSGPRPRLAASLARGAFARMTHDGRIAGYRFPAESDAESRNWIRTILSAARAVVPGAGRLEVDESDASGSARFAYERASAERVTKRKLAALGARDACAGELATGEGHVDFDLAKGWLVAAEYREDTRFGVESSSIEVRSSLRLACSDTRFDSFELDERVDWDSAWSSPDGSAERAEPGGGERAASWSAILGRLAALFADGARDRDALLALREDAIARFRSDDAAVAQCALLLADPSRGEDQKRLLLSALGAADSPASRGALLDVAGAGAHGAATRLAAMHALFQAQRLDDGEQARLTRLARDASLSPALGGTALLALGRFASEDRRGGQLFAMEAEAEARELSAHWLEALGNRPRPRAVPVAARYLESADARERAAAVGAIRQVAQPSATRLLSKALATDSSARVRSAAAVALAGRASTEARAALRRALREDPVEHVRKRALAALGARAHDSGARALLRDSAQSDPSPRLRAFAQRLLRGRP